MLAACLLIVDLKWGGGAGLFGFPGLLQGGEIAPSDLLSNCDKDFSSSSRYRPPWAGLCLATEGKRSRELVVLGSKFEQLVAGAGLVEPARRKALDFGHRRLVIAAFPFAQS